MKSPLTFQICTPSDAVVLSDIALESYPPHYAYLWEDEGDAYMQKYYSPEMMLQELNNPFMTSYLIMLEGTTIGFLQLTDGIDWQGNKNQDFLELKRVYLLENATGKGAGAQALKFTIAKAKQQGKKKIWLKVMDSSQALIFYKKNGFKWCADFVLQEPKAIEKYKGMYVMEYDVKNDLD